MCSCDCHRSKVEPASWDRGASYIFRWSDELTTAKSKGAYGQQYNSFISKNFKYRCYYFQNRSNANFWIFEFSITTGKQQKSFITLQIYITIQFFSGVSRILLVNIYSENTGQSASKTLFWLRDFENERKYHTGNGKSSQCVMIFCLWYKFVQ